MTGRSRGMVIWFTGLPASGKSTLAAAVARRLDSCSLRWCVLDSDEVRAALAPNAGFGDDDRDRVYGLLANLAALLARQGLIVLVPATAHRRAFRERARAAAPHFIEVFVDTSPDECRRRDPRRLYSSSGALLPGAGIDYERPLAPHVTAHGGNDDHAVRQIIALIVQRCAQTAHQVEVGR